MKFQTIKGTNWIRGEFEGREFQAKIYDEDSMFGINEGRVSKLFADGLCAYEREWYERPNDYDTFDRLMNELESLPKGMWK